MRWDVAIAVMLLICMVPSTCNAGVMVSPVKIEAHAVSVGDEIVLNCSEIAGHEQTLYFSLALFDQDEFGGVVLREDHQSQVRAAEIVELSCNEVVLAPYEQRDVRLTINAVDFDSYYVVVFVTPEGTGGVSSRLAVLLFLSTEAACENIAATSVHLDGESLAITFHNSGNKHGREKGTLALYDESGTLVGEYYIDTGAILPDRQRRANVILDSELSATYFTFQGQVFGRQQFAAEGPW